MTKLSKEAKQKLEDAHRMYCDYNQKERSDCALMASLGHPKTKLYRSFREFFDGLKYAANSSARFFSYIDSHNSSEYWAPELSLTWRPTGQAFRGFVDVYPAHDDWDRYIKTAASAGWPEGCEPQLRTGTWNVTTTSEELMQALCDLCSKEKRANRPNVRRAASDDVAYWDITLGQQGMTLSFHRKVQKLLRQYHKGYILPKRKPEDTASDTAALPLQQKTFFLGNVKRLTVTDRQVLVPLIPIGTDTRLLEETVNGLVGLLRKGFPFAQAESWLKQFLKPAAFRKLQASVS